MRDTLTSEVAAGGVSTLGTDEEITSLVADVLSRRFSRAVAVRLVSRKPCEFATLCPVEVLSVGVDDGITMSLFVKHFQNSDSWHPDKKRGDREVLVYKQLFHGESLPVPAFFGSAVREAGVNGILILENVADWNLKYHSLDLWHLAAGRLADLHRHFAWRPELAVCNFLLKLDVSYFVEWARRALDAVQTSGADNTKLFHDLVLNRFSEAATLLARQPVTLVHNDLAPKNVIANRGTIPTTICIVDWEIAGVGCVLLDLVHLKYGLDSPSATSMV